MNTRYKLILSVVLAWAQIFTPVLAQEIEDGKAFYVYRNDGDFNGFFYDQVQEMRYSKIDLEGVEHEEYVIQEVLTSDSLYRIPLAAIDSIGFQQPEIIISKQLCHLGAADCPVEMSREFFSSDDGYTLTFVCNEPSQLPKSGQILYKELWSSFSNQYRDDDFRFFDYGPFLGKVKEVRVSTYDFPYPDYAAYYGTWYDVVCEPITDLTEVFEQLISVEQLGTDENGRVRRRIAGADGIRRRESNNIDLTLVNLSGRFPFARGDDNFEVSMSLDLSLQVRANVAYCISRQVTYIAVTLKEDAEVGVNFTAKANLGETTTWHLAGAPVYFPALIPIFQVDPSPEAFIKTAGDLSLTVSSPKFAYHGIQSFHLGTDRVSGNCTNNPSMPGDDDNGWGMSLSLNGSIQGGSNFPTKLETNRWAEKALHASIGADVYVGPKISASFSIDPVALVNGDAYNTLKSSNVSLAPVNTTFEANATYSIKGKSPSKVKFFEGNRDYFLMKLTVFPEFEDIEVTQKARDTKEKGNVGAKIFPRGNSLPFKVGLAAYKPDNTGKMQLIDKVYGTEMYGFNSTFPEQQNVVDLLDGTYTLCPVISAFDYDVPVWEKKITAKRSLLPSYNIPQYGSERETVEGDGHLYISGILPDDHVEIEFVEGKSHHSVQNSVYDWCPDRDGICYYPQLDTGTTDDKPLSQKVEFTLDESGEPQVSDCVGPEVAYRYHYTFKNNLEKYSNSSQIGKITAPCTDTYTYHNEKNVFRIKVTRADGRVFYTDNFTFEGHGPIQNSNTGEITIE